MNEYCQECGVHANPEGNCPNCKVEPVTLEEMNTQLPEFQSKIPEEYRKYLARDVRE